MQWRPCTRPLSFPLLTWALLAVSCLRQLLLCCGPNDLCLRSLLLLIGILVSEELFVLFHFLLYSLNYVSTTHGYLFHVIMGCSLIHVIYSVSQMAFWTP